MKEEIQWEIREDTVVRPLVNAADIAFKKQFCQDIEENYLEEVEELERTEVEEFEKIQ